ncbi:hypothetical protein, partial [Streptomyces sp. NPDC001966]
GGAGEAGAIADGDQQDGGVLFKPLRQPFALAFGEHLGEGPHVSGEGVEFVAVDQYGLESKVVDFREGLGAPEDPASDNAG